MKIYKRVVLIFIFSQSFLTLKSQVNISVLTNTIKLDHYSFGGSDLNYGIKFNGEYYFPDLQMDIEYKSNVLSILYKSNRFFNNIAFNELKPSLIVSSSIKSFGLSLGRQIKLTERFQVFPTLLFQRNFDSYIEYFAGIINGWEGLICESDYGKYSYGLALAVDFNFSTHFLTRFESSFVRYSHLERRCPDYPLGFSHLNLWSNSLKIGYKF